MQERLVDKLSEPFKLDTPEGNTMAKKIESILPSLKGRSKGLGQTGYFVNRHWRELSDDPKMIEERLLIFRYREDSESPVSSGAFETFEDGHLKPGRWRDIGEGKLTLSQTLIDDAAFKMTYKSAFDEPSLGSDAIAGARIPEETILYKLLFLDEDFIIIRRHGNLPKDQEDNLGSKRYRLFVREGLAAKEKLEWDDALEYLLNKYRSMAWYYIVAVLLFATAIIIMLSYSRQ